MIVELTSNKSGVDSQCLDGHKYSFELALEFEGALLAAWESHPGFDDAPPLLIDRDGDAWRLQSEEREGDCRVVVYRYVSDIDGLALTHDSTGTTGLVRIRDGVIVAWRHDLSPAEVDAARAGDDLHIDDCTLDEPLVDLSPEVLGVDLEPITA